MDSDGTTVQSIDFGLAAQTETGPQAPTVAATGCYSVASLSLTRPGPIGDEDRAFALSQRGLMDQTSGAGPVTAEAEARGTFSEGQASGTLMLRFVERPDCDGAPVSWTALPLADHVRLARATEHPITSHRPMMIVLSGAWKTSGSALMIWNTENTRCVRWLSGQFIPARSMRR